jgi:hypothetical protein
VTRALVAAALILAACNRSDPRCTPTAPAVVELRDCAGALLLADKDGALCNAAHRAVGTVELTPTTVTLKDADGRVRLVLQSAAPDNTGTGSDAAGNVRVRLYRDAIQARVLHPDGAPIGSMVHNGGGARVYGPTSAPLTTVEPHDRDLVLRDNDGVTRNFVVPGKDARAAGVFAMNGFDVAEQLAIYLYWSR